MTRFKLLASLSIAIAVLASAATLTPAEEPPYLDFVRTLRARQMPDLALEYLKELSKKKLPPEITLLLPLEEAKTHLELALVEEEEPGRARERQRARDLFDAFVKANPTNPLVAEANLQIARLTAMQGQAQLGKARRQEHKDAQKSELQKARARFEEAAGQFKAAAATLDAQLASATPETKPVLQQARLQAEFELALNLYDQAQSYADANDLQKRGEIVKSAIELLGKVASKENKNPLCLQAKAWQGRCYQENDDPKMARKLYAEVIAEPGEAADGARRLARYFRMGVLAKDPDPKKPVATLQEIQQVGERWLQEYRKYRSSPEGAGVRFELANAYLKEALTKPNTQQGQIQTRDLLSRAQKLYQELEQGETDYTEQARENKLSIILRLSSDRSRGDITKLANFEECYLRAQFEVAQLNKAEKDLSGDKLEAKKKEHLANILGALQRAFDMADNKVPSQELADARYLQTRSFFALDDYYRAAVTGEEFARSLPQAARAPSAGAYALYAYAQLLGAEEQQAGTAPESVEADRNRIRRLAEYLEKTWPNDPAADVARHQVGRLFLVEKKYPEAVDVLARVSPTYSDATRSLYQLAFAALQAQKTESKPLAGKPPYQDMALAALRAVPEPSSGADAGTMQVYLDAKLTLGAVLHTAKDFAGADALAKAMADKIAAAAGSFDNATRADFEAKVLGLKLLALDGASEKEYAAGNYAKVREALDPILNQLKDPAQAAKLAQLKDPGLLPAVLGLAIRANVQDNKIDKARETLDVLKKLAPETSGEILKQLVQQMRFQVVDLRQKGDAVKPRLEQTIQNFTAFLDQLAKSQGDKPQAEMLFFLAQSYAGMDNHSRAGELLQNVQEPQPEGEDKAPDPKKVQLYRAARILCVREFRLDKQYDRAKTLLEGMIGTPEKPAWGAQHIDVQRERVLILQDQEKYAGKDGAILAWNGLMRQLQLRMKTDAKVKEPYFECYYYLVYCLYKNAEKVPDAKKRQAAIRQAANYLVQLEQTQPDLGGETNKKRFDELLKAEQPLRDMVEQLKKGTR